MTIRAATLDDVPWMLSIAKLRYGSDRNWEASEAWLRAIIANPQGMFVTLRGSHTLAIMTITTTFWENEPRAFLLPVVSHPGAPRAGLGRNPEIEAILDAFASYAKLRGCVSLEGGSETDSDVGLLLKRRGASSHPVWKLEL